jgi:tRNA nucleotidyltransferase/poly(A) polymerase/mannose-6-phosphate isomerase-like protein (cupin superfamily)
MMNKLSQFLVSSILEDEVTAEKNTTTELDNNPLHISKEIVEEWVITHLPKVLKEASITGGFLEVDDGPNFFFRDFRVFDKVSKARAEQIGYEVVKQIMDASFQDLTVYPEYPNGPVKAVTPFPAGVIGKTTATNQKDFGSDRAYDLWFKHARRVATIVGYSLVRDKDEIERRLAISSAKDIYTDETTDEPSSVNESTFFTKEELTSITDDIMNELGGLMIGYAGKDDIENKQKQLKKLRKKLDKTTPNYSAVKETYDKLEFYLNYYKNLTPSGFSVDKQNNNIVISLNPVNENDMGKLPYVVDIDDLTINNTDFRNTKWTGENLQMTVMSIEPNQSIGVEVHTDGDQFLRVEDGEGEVYMGKTKENLDYIKKIKDDTAIFIPAGFWHDVKNTSSTPLKLYVIYSPVEHPKGKVDAAKPIEEVITEAQSKLKLNIPQSVRKIHSAFKKSGKKLYVVGGAVRDAILGKSPKDFDLATDAKPDEVIQIAQKNGFRYTEVGKAFGVVVIDDMEIATFRADIGKGRRPDSVEYTDIYGDVLRRDLTINALFYDLDKGEIVDLVGGIKDLQKNKIRTVGNAIERFDEDPLRKLRAIRFAARLGGKLDKSTLEAIVADPTLKGVSEERIRDEFIKSIQSAKSVVDYLKVMSGTKLLHQCFPNMTWKTSDFIEEKNPIILLAYLFRRNTPQNLYKQLMRLKYSHDESNSVKFLIELSDFKPENIFKLKKQQQNTVLSDADILRWGKLIGTNFTKFVRFNLTVKGNDVMKMGKRGAEIGKEIERLETQRFLSEDITIPVEVGDTILTGRFKNKKTKVNIIGKDEHGMPTVNGRKVVNFRIEKKPKEDKL